jgi:hypothetical protein
MNITLGSYQPFDCSRALKTCARSTWNEKHRDWIDVCNQVGKIALMIIAFLPAIILDLVLLPIFLAHQNFCPAPSLKLGAILQQPRFARIGKVPTKSMINQIKANPYPHFPFGLTDVTFFQDALKFAFSLLEKPKQEEYKRYIAEDNPEQVNIYLWSASALIIHYLRSKNQSIRADLLFPRTFPNSLVPIQGQAEEARRARIQKNDKELQILLDQYSKLSHEDRACAFLQILVPEIQWQLTHNSQHFMQNIHAKALEITQNNDFNIQIYRQAIERLENI